MPSRAQSYTLSQRTRRRRTSSSSASQKVTKPQHIYQTSLSPASPTFLWNQAVQNPQTRHQQQLEHPIGAPPKQTKSTTKLSNGPVSRAKAQSGSFKFVTATSTLETFKDKQSLNEIRRHVMVDWLSKQNTDANSLERRRDSVQGLELPDSPSNHAGQLVEVVRDAISNKYTLELYNRSNKRKSPALSSEDVSQIPNQREHNKRPVFRDDFVQEIAQFDAALLTKFAKCDLVDPSRPLVIPADVSKWIPATYQLRTLEGSSMGLPLDPFGTMARSRHREVNSESLKYNCKFLYGSKAMVSTWTRDLGHTPHGFISTLYLSSTHLDVMQGTPNESLSTRLLRDESIQLVLQRFTHTSTSVHDTTIQAALTILCGEIITGSSREAIQWHEDGIEKMVSLRGGLETLGFRELTAIITMVFCQSAIFRESQVSEIFSRCLWRVKVSHSDPTKPVPESPIYCPCPDGHFITIAASCRPETLELLTDMRLLTDMVVVAAGSFRRASTIARTLSEPEMQMQRILYRLQDRPSAVDSTYATHNDWTYESCRLAALIYSTAIAKRTSISAAVLLLPGSAPPGSSGPALLAQLKTALEKSRAAEECWMDSKMTGVLYWITLVAGAACSRFLTRSPSLSSLGGSAECVGGAGDYLPQEEERFLRKWFAAVSVRCTILMGFEHAIPVLLSLRKMLGVLELLAPGGGRGDWGEVNF